MDNKYSNALAQLLFSITSANLEVCFTTEPENAKIGDIRYKVKLPKEIWSQVRTFRPSFFSNLTANFLGEWFVRANLDRFEHHACTMIDSRGWSLSQHRSFGLKLEGEYLCFAFHASLLQNMERKKPAAAAKPGSEAAGKNSIPADGGAVGDKTAFMNWLSGIPLLRPRQMFDKLAAEGYVGQDASRIAVCLMAYRHIRRLRMIHIDGVPRSELPPKENILLMGPTGCGKTYLVELLFSRILGLPTIIADMTSFTETGYIGDSVSNLFTRLVQAAGGDQLKAAVGVICLDEFDKLAACGSRARFGGQGTTKDVSGYGVQRELLKLLETTNVHAGEGQESEKTQVRTADIPFIACGAFSGFKAVIKSMQYEPCIGFGVKVKRQKSRKVITERVAAEEVAPVANFAEYGMLPELMGRFSRIVPLQPMGVDELMKILTNQVIVRYQKELASEGVRLEIEPPILERIARECLKMETGARGIVASLAAHLENACFDVYSLQDPSGSVIRVREESGRITTELTAGTGDGEIGAVTLQALCA